MEGGSLAPSCGNLSPLMRTMYHGGDGVGRVYLEASVQRDCRPCVVQVCSHTFLQTPPPPQQKERTDTADIPTMMILHNRFVTQMPK